MLGLQTFVVAFKRSEFISFLGRVRERSHVLLRVAHAILINFVTEAAWLRTELVQSSFLPYFSVLCARRVQAERSVLVMNLSWRL